MRSLKSIALAVALTVAPAAGLSLMTATPALAWQSNAFDNGVKAYNSGDYQAAVRYYGQATKDEPGNATAWAYYGDALSRVERNDDAEQAYRKSIEIDPNCFSCLEGIGSNLFNAKREAEALPYYQRAADLQPDNARMIGWLGDAYLRLDRLEEARAAYQRALRVDAREVGALRGMVFYYALKNDETSARRELETLRRVDSAEADRLGALFDE